MLSLSKHEHSFNVEVRTVNVELELPNMRTLESVCGGYRRTAVLSHSHRLATTLLAVNLLLAAAGQAADAPRAGGAARLAEIVERVERTCKGVQDLSAKFVQTATNRSLGQVQEASGLFLLKRPGKMRWEYQKPEERLFVTDGKTLWAYSPLEKQVIVQEITQAFTSRTPISFLAGDCDLARAFDVSAVEHAGTRGAGVAILDLKPKRPEGGIARVLLEVSLKTHTIEKTTLFDAYGNTTVVAFSNLKLNSGLSDAQFTFAPPAGVTVVTPPKH